jgi:hypothetical protein
MWARSIGTLTTKASPASDAGTSTSRYPSNAIGSSYCDVWKFFGMSG